MSYVICDQAGKYPQCAACPNAVPIHEHALRKPCPVGDKMISFITKVKGKLVYERGWRFRTVNKLVVNVPVINKTARKEWNMKNEHRKAVWAWMENKSIEILRFVDK